VITTQQSPSKSRRRLQSISRIRESAGSITVFNGGDEPAILIHDAMRYTFPPSGYWMGPGDDEPREYDGTLAVKDVYGVATETMREARKDKKDLKNLPREALIVRAVEIAQHAELKLRSRGIVVLTGDPEQDAPLKKEAKNAYVAWRLDRARRADLTYRQRSAAFFNDPRNAGQVPPTKTPFEIAEQMWLDEYMDGNVGGRKYVCKFRCGFEHDDVAIYTRHLRVAHRDSREGTSQVSDVPVELNAAPVAAPKRRGGRPKKQVEAPAP
jgi:hypothetical protein